MDDILLSTTNDKDRDWFKSMLEQDFELSADSAVDPAHHYLGMKITRDYDQKSMKLSSPALVESILNDVVSGGFLSADAGVKNHPMAEAKLTSLEEGEEVFTDKMYPYRQVVGVCLHLSRTTRPDIALAVSELSSHVTKFGERHARAANFLLCYLKGTQNVGVTYHGHQPAHLLNKVARHSSFLSISSTAR